MNYLFDASSVFKAIKENRVEILAGNLTLELARYELGNTLWKQTLREHLNREELRELTTLTTQVLSLMHVQTIAEHEEEVLETALELNLTFYDASYLYSAKQNNLPLVTEDTHLRKSAEPAQTVQNLDETS